MPNSKKENKLTKKFQRFAEKVDGIVGSPYWFAFSLLIVLIWIPSGYFLGWGEIWHLMINTTTTILTFLMMSLLHSSEAKWEKRMESLQLKETSELKTIQQTTEQLAEDKQKQSEKTKEVESIL